MEELLNKLIKRGWEPFGWDDKLSSLHKEFGVGKWYIRFHNGMDSELFDLRQLTSKESGLWQFVCENKLVKLIDNPNENKCPRDRMSEEEKRIWEYDVYYSFSRKEDIHKRYEQDSPTYRLIESALCDEDKLEEFLLENIKIS